MKAGSLSVTLAAELCTGSLLLLAVSAEVLLLAAELAGSDRGADWCCINLLDDVCSTDSGSPPWLLPLVGIVCVVITGIPDEQDVDVVASCFELSVADVWCGDACCADAGCGDW